MKQTGCMLSFGQATSGQLGRIDIRTPDVPQVVEGDWLPPSTVEDFKHGSLVDRGDVIRRIFAGGEQSFASIITRLTFHGDVSTCAHCIIKAQSKYMYITSLIW